MVADRVGEGGVRAIGEDGLHQSGGRGADGAGPVDEARGRPLETQAALFPRESAVEFGAEEAALAAILYRVLRRPRGREVDLAIAAAP